MYVHPYKHAENRFECRNRPRCYKSVKHSVLIDALIRSLEQSSLPELERKVQNKDGDSAKIQQRLLAKLEKQMQEYRVQEDNQYELLETHVYTQDLFDRRNAALRQKMDLCQKQIYEVKQKMPKSVDYSEVIVSLKDTIAILKDPTAKPADQNRALKRIVKNISFTGQKSTGLNRKGTVRNENNFSIKITLVV